MAAAQRAAAGRRSVKSVRKKAAGTSTQATDRYKVEAVSRAVHVMDAMRQHPGAVSLEELAKRTRVPVAAVSAILETLVGSNLVQRSGDAPVRYRLGMAWLRLADVKRQQLDMREVALPVMRRIRDAINETVSLGIRIGANRVNIEYAEGRHEVRRITQPGYHVTLHVGAGGRVMLSGLDDAEIAAYFNALKIGGAARAKLIAGIKAARQDGYSVVIGEVTSDTAAVSAPVRNHAGDIVAVITISCPDDRFTPLIQTRCIREAVRGGDEISLALGFDPKR